MTIVNVLEAKTNLSRLIAEVEAGGEVIIARNNKPVVRLVATTPAGVAEPAAAMAGAAGDARGATHGWPPQEWIWTTRMSPTRTSQSAGSDQ